jgi:phosphate:Na+ symporter
MVDVFEAMLRRAFDSLNRGDRKRVVETASVDTVLNRLDTAIKEYLTSIDSDALDDIEARHLTGSVRSGRAWVAAGSSW